jgi:hypothetical protein
VKVTHHAYAGTEERQRYSFSTFPSMVLEGVVVDSTKLWLLYRRERPITSVKFMGVSYGGDGPRIVI